MTMMAFQDGSFLFFFLPEFFRPRLAGCTMGLPPVDVVGVVRPGSGLFVVRYPYDHDQGVFSAELMQGPKAPVEGWNGMGKG